MFKLNRVYKVEMMREGEPFFYTGLIIEETPDFIILENSRDGEVIISLKHIVRATLVEEDGF